ncbi:MAG: acyl-CoA dehydrogenase family protein [Myxococcota bacterium]|nr:acyl-CoA dehydrogenase family protein [Myxococcota bacterium]
MISFGPTEEQELIRDAMREFAAEALRPAAREQDEASELSQELLDTIAQLGLVSTSIPETFGGGGEARSPITNALVLEELACGDASVAVAALAPAAFANVLLDFGTEAQQRAHLPAFCADTFHTASLALLEPGAFSDPALPKTKAEPKGDGSFVLSGAKSFVPFGDTASHFLVTARNNGGVDAFIVPRDPAGLRIGEREGNMGLKALPTNGLELERVEVSADAKLGGDAGCDVRHILDGGRAAIAAVLTGLSRGVLEYCVPYTKDRVAFDEPIARKQAIAFMLAEMHMETEGMRWLTWQAASALEHDDGREDRTKTAYQARSIASEKGMWIADNGVQCLGGHGYIREHPVEMWYRNARTLGVLEGTLYL